MPIECSGQRLTGNTAHFVLLPLIARDALPATLVTNEDIADAFDAEDVERHVQVPVAGNLLN